jgi:hypothetical protein
MTDPAAHARSTASPWATGTSIFAASVLMIVGFLQFFQGLVAAIDGEEFLVTPNYVFELDTTAWGWGHMLIGIVVGLTGLFILTGNVVARAVGILIASISAIVNFLWIPYYPFWGVLLVSLNILVIWALSISNLAKDV